MRPTGPPNPLPIEGGDIPPTPKLPGSVVVRMTAEEAIDSLAADLLFQAIACTRRFGDFHLALSGGSTPEPLYKRLMTDPAYRQLPWEKTHLWIVDERRVPFDDPKSNFAMIRETLGDHSGIPEDNIHPIEATSPAAASDYEKRLNAALAWREKGHGRLDFVVLGMGDDCHTASLFPHSPALGVTDRLVAENDGPGVTPPARVTMTYPLLNAARMLAVLVLGEKKREAIARAAAGGTSEEMPVLGLNPMAGELRWYLDYAACPRAAREA